MGQITVYSGPERRRRWSEEERLQVGCTDLIEQLAARAAELAKHAALVEIGKALGDGSVEL